MIVIIGVSSKQTPKMLLAKHHHMIKAFPSDRADQSLRVPILPWRQRVLDAHSPDQRTEISHNGRDHLNFSEFLRKENLKF
ncbi:MAG: hypothetical protein ACM3TN_23175 [Alphaproteobacteria bacterium]